MVEGDIFKDVDIYMIFLLLGNFRLVRCLHCNKLVRRGKDGCTSREASNSGMAAHMRSKHAGQAIEVRVFFFVFDLLPLQWQVAFLSMDQHQSVVHQPDVSGRLME